MSTSAQECRKFSPNIFIRLKCQNCFRTKDAHSAEALESNRATRKISKCGYLFVAPDWDFSVSVNRTKRWQRRWFVLYDDGELTYSVDEHPETVPQAVVDMNQAVEVNEAEDLTGNPFSLALTTSDKVHFIKATSKDEFKWWFDVLQCFPKNTVRAKHKRNATFPGIKTSPIGEKGGRPGPEKERYLSDKEWHEMEEAKTRTENANNKLHNTIITIQDKENLNEEIPIKESRSKSMLDCSTEILKGISRRYLKRESRGLKSQRSRSDGVAKMIPDQRNCHQNPVFLLLSDPRHKDGGEQAKPPPPSPEETSPTKMEPQIRGDPDGCGGEEDLRRGWLNRQVGGQWHRHWFVLGRQSLRYYRGPGADVLEGALDLGHLRAVAPEEGPGHAFALSMTDGRRCILAAPTDSIRGSWVQAILQAALPPSPPVSRTAISRVKARSRSSSRSRLPDNDLLSSSHYTTESQEESSGVSSEPSIDIVDTKSNELECVQNKYRELEDQYSTLKKKYELMEKPVDTPDYKTLKTKYEALKQKYKRDRYDSESLTKDPEKIKKECERKSKKDAEISKLKATIYDLQQKCKNFEKMVEDQKVELSYLNASLDARMREHQELEKELFRSQEALSAVLLGGETEERSKLQRAREMIHALQQELRSTRQAGDDLELAVCRLRQELGAQAELHRGEVRGLAARVNDLTEKLYSAERSARQARQRVARAERRRSSLKGKECEAKLSELEQKLTMLETQLEPGPRIRLQVRHSEESAPDEDWSSLSLSTSMSDLRTIEGCCEETFSSLNECCDCLERKSDTLLQWLKQGFQNLGNQHPFGEILAFLEHSTQSHLYEGKTELEALLYNISLLQELVRILKQYSHPVQLEIEATFEGAAKRIDSLLSCVSNEGLNIWTNQQSKHELEQLFSQTLPALFQCLGSKLTPPQYEVIEGQIRSLNTKLKLLQEKMFPQGSPESAKKSEILKGITTKAEQLFLPSMEQGVIAQELRSRFEQRLKVELTGLRTEDPALMGIWACLAGGPCLLQALADTCVQAPPPPAAHCESPGQLAAAELSLLTSCLQHYTREKELEDQVKALNEKLEEDKQRHQKLQEEYDAQVQSLQEMYSQKLSQCTEIKMDDSLRRRYKKEIDQLKALCDKGLTAMENSHRHIIEELTKSHQREIQQLQEEKDKLLAEETKATICALEALKRSHQEELEKLQEELARSRNIMASPLQDVREELAAVRKEMVTLLERSSGLERVSLEERLQACQLQLREAGRQVLELAARNQQLRARLTSDLPRGASPDLQQALEVRQQEVARLQDETVSLRHQLHLARTHADSLTIHCQELEETLHSLREEELCHFASRLEALIVATSNTAELPSPEVAKDGGGTLLSTPPFWIKPYSCSHEALPPSYPGVGTYTGSAAWRSTQ